MKSPVAKRSIVLRGRKTSVSLEDAFWQDLKIIAAWRGLSISDLVSRVDTDRQHTNLSSALRVFVLEHHLQRCAQSRAQTEREQLAEVHA